MNESHTHTLDQARAAKPPAQEVFEALAEVVGIGITKVENGYGLKVNLRKSPPADAVVPTQVDGVPVRLEVVGQPHPQ